MFRPDIAIVDIAQQRLHPLDRLHGRVEFPWVHTPGDLQRISEPLRRNPHGVVTRSAFRIGQTVLLPKQLVELAADVPLGLGVGGGGRQGLARQRRVFQDPLAHASHLPQNAFGFQAIDGLDDLPLQPFTVALQLDQDAGDSRKALLGVQADRMPQRNSICTSGRGRCPTERSYGGRPFAIAGPAES